jgi:hypothetical protein
MKDTFDLDNLFDEVQAAEIQQATEKKEGKSYTKFNEDERFIQFKAGNTYQFRLLYSITDPAKRKRPFIARFNHSFWDDSAEYNKLTTITCPTSEYILHDNGFNKCPVCKATRKFYKDGKDGSQTSKELYDQFRRKFHGYALVYVVNDPTNEENNGQIKIMHFGITIHKWLRLQIFGINDKGKLVDDDTIGRDAFSLENGFNLKIAVSKKGEYNKYDCEFARKTTAIDITKDDIATAAEELKFDEEFCTRSTEEEINDFYKTKVLSEEANKDASDELDLSLDDDEKDEIPMDYEETPKEKVVEEKAKSKPKETAPEKEEPASDDIDIDNILAKVKNK